MICPNCQTSNRADSKFCKSCGASLSQISPPKMSPMQPGKQSFQAQQRPVEMHKPEPRFQEGTPIAYRANVPPAGAPQTLRPTGSSERTAMPPPQTFYSAPQAYPPQTSPYYQQQPNVHSPQTPPIEPPIELVKKKPFIFLSVLLVFLIIALVLVLTVFRPMITRRIIKADGTDSTPLASGLIMNDSEEPDPEWGSPPGDEPNLIEEPIPVEDPAPTEPPRPIYIASGQAITSENADQLQQIARLSAGSAKNIVFSPDGSYVAIATSAGLDIYDIQSKEIYKKLNVDEKVSDVVFLHDGSLLAGTDFGIDHYSADDFNYLQSYDTDRIVYSLSLSADGKTLLSNSSPDSLVYKINDGVLERSHKILYNIYIRSFDLSPDGTKVATGSSGGELKIWEVESGFLLHEVNAHSGSINEISWSPDGSILATASEDQTVVIWNADGTKNKTLNTFESNIHTVKFSPDGKRLITGTAKNEAQIWDFANASLEKTLTGGTKKFYDFELDASGKKLIGRNGDGTVVYWDVDSDSYGEQISKYNVFIEPPVVSPLGDKIYYYDAIGFSSMCNSKGDVLWSDCHEYDDQMLAPAFSVDGSMLIAGTNGGYVKILDAESGEELSQFKAHDAVIRRLVISPDGKTIATASDDTMVKLWSFDTHELLATLAGHNAAVSALAFSPDGTYLASAGDEPLIIMWDPKTAKQLYQLESHEDKVFALAFSPDGNFLASAGFSNLVIIWDPKTGSQLQKFKTKGGIAFDMAFSTDSKSIFVPSSSNIELHSIETGNLITDIGDSLGRVYSVLISTDGKTMISCGSEGIVRVFRVP